MESIVLTAERRERVGTKHAQRVRQRGRIPAIIYGHGEDPEPIALDSHDADVELHHGSRVLNVLLDGKKQQYLIKAVQYDYLGTTPIHLDLVRVNLDEKVRVSVGIELRGTPQGLSDGGVLDQQLANIEVECVVTAIPDTLRPRVAHLQLGDSLTVKDLPLPEGVTALANPEQVVATVRALAEETEPTEVEVEGEAAEPERIGRVRADEDAADTGGSSS